MGIRKGLGAERGAEGGGRCGGRRQPGCLPGGAVGEPRVGALTGRGRGSAGAGSQGRGSPSVLLCFSVWLISFGLTNSLSFKIYAYFY